MKKDLSPEVFTSIYQPPVTKGDGYDHQNLVKAGKLLDAASWTIKKQRRVNTKTGKPQRFQLLSARGNDQWVIPFKYNLTRLSIGMGIRQGIVSKSPNQRRSQDYEMILSVNRVSPQPNSDLQITYGFQLSRLQL